MVQLDLFGFAEEEKPVKKQEAPAVAAKPAMQKAPTPPSQEQLFAPIEEPVNPAKEPIAEQPVPELFTETSTPVVETPEELVTEAGQEIPATAETAPLFIETPQSTAATEAEEAPVEIEEATTAAADLMEDVVPELNDEINVMEAPAPITIVQLAEEANEVQPTYPLYEEASLPPQEELAEEAPAEGPAPIVEVTEEPQPTEEVVEINYTLFGKADAPQTAVKRAPTKGKRGRKSFKDIDAELALVEVPADEELFTKMYYPISVVAKWFNVNTSLLRFWENEFDILKPRKNRKGDRMFRPEDVKNLQVIYHLLRQRKFSIEGAKKYLKQNKSQVDVNLQLIQSLTKFRSFLLEIKANLGA